MGGTSGKRPLVDFRAFPNTFKEKNIMSLVKRELDAQNAQEQSEIETVWTKCPECYFDWDSKLWFHCEDHGDEEEVAACAWEGYAQTMN
jgi:hypothetical protein